MSISSIINIDFAHDYILNFPPERLEACFKISQNISKTLW